MKSEGNKNGAEILLKIADKNVASSIADKLSGKNNENRVTVSEALSLVVDAELTKSQYNQIKKTSEATNKLYPSYKEV